MKLATLTIAALAVCGTLRAEWKYGVGSALGIFDLNADVTFGATDVDINYDVIDVESAFGFSGYAANGPWRFNAAVAYLEVEASQSVFGGSKLQDANFERLIWELTADYTFHVENDWAWSAYGGIRSVKHEWNAPGFAFKVNEDWVDLIVGLRARYAFAERWAWVSSVELGFGESEGTYSIRTGLNWQFAQNWSSHFLLSFDNAQYEDGSSSSADYYSYDADTTTLGLGVTYHF